MRILFLSNLYPPNAVGGYERLCFEMASALAARQHEVAVLTSDHGGETADYPGQRIRRTWKLAVGKRAIYEPFEGSAAEKQAVDAHNIACLDEEMRAFAPDVLFVWNLFFLDTSLLRTIEKQRRPTVFLLTDNWMIVFLNAGFWHSYLTEHVLDGTHSWLRRLWLRMSRGGSSLSKPRFRLGGSAIFASRFMETLYRDAGITFSDSTVIYHGVTDSSAVPRVARDRFLVRGEVRLLLAGRVVEVKGMHTAIDALPRIAARLPDRRILLTIVGDQGDPQYLQRLRDQIRRLDLDDRVRIQPPVVENELPALFSAHDIFLFPSLYEPFSLTLIHALRAGIPTVASDAGGNVEIVSDGRTGKVFRRADVRSLANQVVQLAHDDGLRAAVAEGGRRIAAEYTFSRMVDQVERYLESRR